MQHFTETSQLMAQDMALIQKQLYAIAIETIYQSIMKSKELAGSIAQFKFESDINMHSVGWLVD